LLKITPIDFKPIGVGRDFLLPFLSRKKGESNKTIEQTILKRQILAKQLPLANLY